MKQRYQSIILFTILLIVLALILLWTSGRLVTSIQQPPTEAWDAPGITPDWWNQIVPPSETPTPFSQ